MTSTAIVQKPLFLVGSERSGTTLLRLMLNSHPQLAWNEEFEYVVDLVPAERGWPPLDTYHRYLAHDFIFASSKFFIDTALNYPQLANSFLLQKLARDGKSIVGATVHRHFSRLVRIWPDARFVHLIRDGRDVARSIVEMGWAGNAWRASLYWEEAQLEWEKLCRQVPDNRRVEIRFEELVTNPPSTLQKICAFCGVSFHPAMLEYPRTSTYGPPDPSAVAAWKRKMSLADVRAVEAAIGPMLVARGYALSGHPPVALTAARRGWLKANDFYGRLRFRIERFGMNLVFQDFLARRIRIRPWQERVRLRLNDIERLHLK
jgi:hypothetical protein